MFRALFNVWGIKFLPLSIGSPCSVDSLNEYKNVPMATIGIRIEMVVIFESIKHGKLDVKEAFIDPMAQGKIVLEVTGRNWGISSRAAKRVSGFVKERNTPRK